MTKKKKKKGTSGGVEYIKKKWGFCIRKQSLKSEKEK